MNRSRNHSAAGALASFVVALWLAPVCGKEASLGIRFRGFLPGSIDPGIEGRHRVEFRIYKSPQGGEPIWREVQEVEVKRGRIDVELGRVRPIPWEIHEATFKFLGASVNGNREVYPRFPIVNVVYASPREALTAGAEAAREGPRSRGEGEPAPPSYDGLESRVSAVTESPLTWREALESARSRGADLPDYAAWYRALETSRPDEIQDRTGHYEWVLPWVYDTASHGRYNRYFRGRFEGCDYMDLSPEKRYKWRPAHRGAAAGASATPPKEAGARDAQEVKGQEERSP